MFLYIQGTILNVECAVIKAAEGFEKLDVDPDSTVFHENGGKSRRYTQILRIFYVIGTPAKETLGNCAKLHSYQSLKSIPLQYKIAVNMILS